MLQSDSAKLQSKYWYRFYIRECPVCMRDSSYKERVFGEKPADKDGRYVYEEGYCGCLQ